MTTLKDGQKWKMRNGGIVTLRETTLFGIQGFKAVETRMFFDNTEFGKNVFGEIQEDGEDLIELVEDN